MPERICPQCGKTFIQKNNRKKIYCSKKCYKAYYTNVYPKKRWENEKNQKTEMKSAAGSSIAEISRLARAAHMTYGQYVAAMKI